MTTLNQFGLEALDVSKAEMLCVPSRTEVLTTVPDDDDGSHDHR